MLRAELGWTIDTAASPVVATAIHAGGSIRDECIPMMQLPSHARLYEEDPFTDLLIQDFPNRIVVHRSRFEVDLNRDATNALYLNPDQAWGLTVWKDTPAENLIERSLRFHAEYYDALRAMLEDIVLKFGRVVVVDVHSYNHRRAGAGAEATPQSNAPDINIGTSSMDRERWATLLNGFIDALRGHTFRGRPIDVRENVSFQGKGEQTRFIHEHFPETGCAIAVEFKKIFMDEWTGEPDRDAIASLRQTLSSTIPVLERLIKESA